MVPGQKPKPPAAPRLSANWLSRAAPRLDSVLVGRANVMRRSEGSVGWRSFEWSVTVLLAICALLLAVCAALMWSYLPAISTTANSSSVTKYPAETEGALPELKEQQALTNSKLDAIRDELRALNQKAAGAASVAPPSGPSSGQGR